MAKQIAKSKHYGVVQGWLQSASTKPFYANAACNQALNKLTYNAYNGRMVSRKNGDRRNLHIFKDGRMVEATLVSGKRATAQWKFEKCTR